MNEEQTDKNTSLKEKEKKQVSILRSGNSKAILEILKELRTDGRNSILPEVIELMSGSENEEVKAACQSLLNDLKSQDSTDFLIAALKEPDYNNIRGELLSACWQNALDYHPHILLFADLLIKEEYAASIEAYTLIENCLAHLDDKVIVQLITTLTNGIGQVSEEKKRLIESLLGIIREY